MLYDHYQRYADNCSVAKVTKVMHQIEKGHHKKVEKQQYDSILLDLITKKANRKAVANLFKAELFLSQLAKNDHILPLIDKKVYVEIIAEGSGEAVSATDTSLSIRLKQFDETGKLIKNSGELEPIKLSPSKMVKGFQIGIDGAKIGETRKIYIHPSYGYTKIKSGASANNLLIYEVQIVDKSN